MQREGNVTGWVIRAATVMAVRVTKAAVLPRAETVQIQGKEWLPGPRSITAHCQRAADLTHVGPVATRFCIQVK